MKTTLNNHNNNTIDSNRYEHFRLELFFSLREGSILSKSRFEMLLESTGLVCTRGNWPVSSSGNYGSFKWTSSVKSLCQLFIKAKLRSQYPHLVSEDSIALDEELVPKLYASLRKASLWMGEMFGYTANNRLLLESFLRIVPKAKLCKLSPEWYYSPGCIKVYLDHKVLDTYDELNELLSKLTEKKGPNNALNSFVRNDENNNLLGDIRYLVGIPTSISKLCQSNIENLTVHPSLLSDLEQTSPLSALPYFQLKVKQQQQLRDVYTREIKLQLHDPSVFTSDGQLKRVMNVLDNETFKKVANMNAIKTISPSIIPDRHITSRNTWNLPCDDPIPKIRSHGQLKVMVEPGQAPAIAILLYMKYFLGLDLSIDYSMPHSVALVRDLVRGYIQPDLCFLTSAAGANIIGKAEIPYSALCFGPRISHAAVHLENAPKIKLVGMMTETPGTASMVLDSLLKNKDPAFRKRQREHLDPSEITQRLNDCDDELLGLMAFPHYDFNTLLNRTLKSTPLCQSDCNIENFLFIHMRLANLADDFALAFRHSWLSLIETPKLLSLVVELLINNNFYLISAARSCGLQFNGKNGD
jgi:hypothetical protein